MLAALNSLLDVNPAAHMATPWSALARSKRITLRLKLWLRRFDIYAMTRRSRLPSAVDAPTGVMPRPGLIISVTVLPFRSLWRHRF